MVYGKTNLTKNQIYILFSSYLMACGQFSGYRIVKHLIQEKDRKVFWVHIKITWQDNRPGLSFGFNR